MDIVLPVFLVIILALSLWALADSKIKWYLKSLVIICLLSFSWIFYSSMHTFLGWGANQKDLPEVLTIRNIVIEEPNDRAGKVGGIYILIQQPAIEYTSKVLETFGYNVEYSEPRLFRIKYSRQLHEELLPVQQATQRGQIVRGTLKKMGKGQSKGRKGSGKDGKGKMGKMGKSGKEGKEGGGSHSPEQEWKFYNLRPSQFIQK